jgi:hypothetical protein
MIWAVVAVREILWLARLFDESPPPARQKSEEERSFHERRQGWQRSSATPNVPCASCAG